MKLLPESICTLYLNFINPVIKFFIRLETNPNFLTTLGLIIQLIAIYFLATGKFIIGGALILIAGTCDIIDGQVAQGRGMGTKFGALYDSVLDRYAEFAMFFGIGYYFIKSGDYFSSIVTFIALGGSLMTSYIRARSEALNFDCRVGIMQRPERIVYIGFASILSGILSWILAVPYSLIPLITVLVIIAFMANYTACQRIWHVYKLTDRGRELLTPNPDNPEPNRSKKG